MEELSRERIGPLALWISRGHRFGTDAFLLADFAGVRRGREHTPKDQYCADRGVFIMENLCNLSAALERGGSFTAHIQPVGRTGMTGLPCRVTAEVEA